MSNIYIYHRCSTDGQIFAQQQECVQNYMARVGISPDRITAIVTEKVSGTVNHTERKLSDLLNTCKSGDVILVSELSRLGRNMSDLFVIVTEACEKGVTITQCKDGSTIENNSIGGKALLFALSLAAEIEVANIRQRTQMGLDYIKDKINRGEEHISRKGNIVTHLGREKGCDNSKANAASVISKQAKAHEWRMNNIGFNAVVRWLREGKSDEFIIDEFNAFHKANPKDFSTPKGNELTAPTLKAWKRQIKSMYL